METLPDHRYRRVLTKFKLRPKVSSRSTHSNFTGVRTITMFTLVSKVRPTPRRGSPQSISATNTADLPGEAAGGQPEILATQTLRHGTFRLSCLSELDSCRDARCKDALSVHTCRLHTFEAAGARPSYNLLFLEFVLLSPGLLRVGFTGVSAKEITKRHIERSPMPWPRSSTHRVALCPCGPQVLPVDHAALPPPDTCELANRS